MRVTEGIWIFGFGSLIYKQGFEYSQKVDGFIKGYKRVFHQGSTDHRGTKEAPGRTVSLVPDNDSVVWGRAFLLAGDSAQQEETLKYLEWREKQYDIRAFVDVFTKESPKIPVIVGALTYIASRNKSKNVNYLGPPISFEALAQQVARASGPSGPNYEYIYGMADSMREMGVEDEETFALETRVKQIVAEIQHPATANIVAIPH